jgi:tRNA pseudouridine55 synthase
MGRRRKGRDIHGILLLDKPAGMSSNQAVQRVRWLFQARKAGHTGTLDPFATVLLPICLGEASKTAGFMLDDAKTYEACAWLGVATETGDIEGAVVVEDPVPDIDAARIDAAMDAFRGDIEQVPPMYSALKHQGQPLYKLAREGREVERNARQVTIHSLELLAWDRPELRFRVHCSKGTYVRTLAEDLAGALGTCAHLKALRRIASGTFDGGMVTMDELEERVQSGDPEALLLPPDAGLARWPMVTLDETSAERFSHGNPVLAPDAPEGPVRVYGASGRILGLGECDASKLLKPKRIFILEKG